MIEYCANGYNDFRIAPKSLSIWAIHFKNYRVRINGTEYVTSTKIFEEAFNKARMWEKLNAG